ncbi:hypothetical protein LCGC14_2638590, partial [marine sediment metagenome]
NNLVDQIRQERTDLGFEENWDLWEDMYFGVLPDRPMASQANVHVPITQEVVDTVDAVAEQALFTASPWLTINPREPMDLEVAKKKEQHLDHVLQVEMLAKERLEPIRFDTALLGTGVCHLPWLRDTDRIRDEEEYDGANEKDMERFVQRYPKASEDSQFSEIVRKLRDHQTVRFQVEYTEAIYDAPDLTHIGLRDWIVRPTAKAHKLYKEVIVGHRFDLRWDDLQALEDSGYYENVDDMKFSTDTEGVQSEIEGFDTRSFEIVTSIVRWRRPGETRESRYLVDFAPETRTVLRILRYPYWHNRVNYIPFYFQRSRRFIYGIGLAQKLEGPQMEVNAAHNLMIDVVSFALPMFIAQKGMESNFNPLRDGMEVGKVWYADNPRNAIAQLPVSVPNSVGVLAGIEASATRHGELSTGATQNVSGLESAFGAEVNVADANLSFLGGEIEIDGLQITD